MANEYDRQTARLLSSPMIEGLTRFTTVVALVSLIAVVLGGTYMFLKWAFGA